MGALTLIVENDVVVKRKRTVAETIQTWLDRQEIDSKNTANGYKSDINQFFQHFFKKNFDSVTVSDLRKKFTFSDIEQYQMDLKKSYANSSVNRKMASIRGIIKYLEANEFPVRVTAFGVDNLSTTESEPYGTFEWEEFEQIIEYVLTEEKGLIKALLFEVAVVTCFRKSALLSMTWKNIQKRNGVWVISVIDKGSKNDEKPISDDLYERLCMIRSGERVFDISEKTVQNTMTRCIAKLGFEPSRNLCFHSFKKCGINEVYKITGGDILAVAQQGNHKSFSTTMKHYLEKQKDFSKMPNLKIGQDADVSKIEEMTKEQLISLFKKCSRSTQLEVLSHV